MTKGFEPIVREFDTWDAFVTQACEPGVWTKTTLASHTSNTKAAGLTGGYGTATWAEAVKFARFGWPEGRERLNDAIAVVMPKREVCRSYGRDVAGEYPIVSLAIAGDPMCMALPKRTLQAGHPVVRIDYGCNVSGGISAKAVLNRGAALLSIIDRLEARGFSTELRIVMQNEPAYGGQGPNFVVTCVYKRAGDALDIDRAAFALTNPSVQRRFKFALQEQVAEAQKHYADTYGGSIYGSIDPDAIYVPGAGDDDEKPELARKRMEQLFEEYLSA